MATISADPPWGWVRHLTEGCFKTPEEAEAWATENGLSYKPYGLMLPNGWETDVDDSREQEDYACLLNDAEVITLEEVGVVAVYLSCQ